MFLSLTSTVAGYIILLNFIIVPVHMGFYGWLRITCGYVL